MNNATLQTIIALARFTSRLSQTIQGGSLNAISELTSEVCPGCCRVDNRFNVDIVVSFEDIFTYIASDN